MTDHNARFDERQTVIRYKGYMIGFMTILVYMIIVFFCEIVYGEEFASGGVIAGIGFWLALGVAITYNIFYGGMFPFTDSGYGTTAAVLLILGVGSAIRMLGYLMDTGGNYISDGKINMAAVEVVGMTVCITLGIITVIKGIADKRKEKDEES